MEMAHQDVQSPPYVILQEFLTWKAIAREIIPNPSGRAPRLDLRIESDNVKLEPDCKLLIQRAFHDCQDVHLFPMLDGMSGVLVFRATATLSPGVHLQYFVKLGDRNEIFTEYFNYVENVRPFIPFHLGPHLDYDRCCLGSDKGIIVGDFVNESESLHNCACDGRATHAIASLFNQTLSGWYLQAKQDSRSISTLLTPLFPKTIHPNRFNSAKKLGAKKKLEELLEVIEKIHSSPVLVGPIHGDLHAKNVLVRTTEAIVIDFHKFSKNYPLVYDAACLEVGLLVDGFAQDKKRATKTWLKTVKPLYCTTNLYIVPACDHPKNPSSWFYNSVRQIRIHARQMEREENQYAIALVVALLKKACKDIEVTLKEEGRRASAYYFAEQILVNIFGLKL